MYLPSFRFFAQEILRKSVGTRLKARSCLPFRKASRMRKYRTFGSLHTSLRKKQNQSIIHYHLRCIPFASNSTIRYPFAVLFSSQAYLEMVRNDVLLSDSTFHRQSISIDAERQGHASLQQIPRACSCWTASTVLST